MLIASGQNRMADSRIDTLLLHDENASATNGDVFPAPITSSLTRIHNDAASVQHDLKPNTVMSESSRTTGCVTNEDEPSEGPQTDQSSSPITGTQRQSTLVGHAGRRAGSHTACTGPCERGKRKRGIHRGENSLTGSLPLVTPATQRRFRGPGKKKKTTPPDFDIPRFSKIREALRRQIFEYNGLHSLQDLWKMVNAFRSRTAEQVCREPSDSLVGQLQRGIEFCDVLEKKDESLLIRAMVERRFYMVQLIAEYRKAKQEKEAGAGFDNVDEAFKRDLFPGKDAENVRSTWDYYLRCGRPLFAAVERYGYGVLLFPLRKVTNKRFALPPLHYFIAGLNIAA